MLNLIILLLDSISMNERYYYGSLSVTVARSERKEKKRETVCLYAQHNRNFSAKKTTAYLHVIGNKNNGFIHSSSQCQCLHQLV